MKFNSILLLLACVLGYCLSHQLEVNELVDDDEFPHPNMTYHEKKWFFARNIWDITNFRTFLYEKRLNFDASFMERYGADMDNFVAVYWKDLVKASAFGGKPRIDQLLAMNDAEFDQQFERTLEHYQVGHDEIPTAGRKEVNSIISMIPFEGQSTRVIGEYLDTTCGKDADRLLGRTMKAIANRLTQEEYMQVIDLAVWAQDQFQFLPRELYIRAMVQIMNFIPIKKP